MICLTKKNLLAVGQQLFFYFFFENFSYYNLQNLVHTERWLDSLNYYLHEMSFAIHLRHMDNSNIHMSSNKVEHRQIINPGSLPIVTGNRNE